MVLLGLSSFLLTVFLLGLRKQEQIVSIVNSDSKTDELSTTPEGENPKAELAAQPDDKGPVLGDGERMLSKKSLTDLRNGTLGVRDDPVVISSVTKKPGVYRSGKFMFSTCQEDLIN